MHESAHHGSPVADRPLIEQDQRKKQVVQA